MWLQRGGDRHESLSDDENAERVKPWWLCNRCYMEGYKVR